jgi:dienelactone hydrolase
MKWLKRIFWTVLTLVALAVIAAGTGYWYMTRHGGVVVREAGLTGVFYARPGTRHHTAVLMLGGSNGGYPYDAAAQALADAGYPTLGLAYFQSFLKQPRGVPEHLADIPLEYFFHAIDWMKTRPEIDPDKIVLMGESRGGELVLLVASLRPDLAGVIAYSPSHVVWGGIEPTWSRPAWTLGGKPVAYVHSTYVKGETLLAMFNRTLANAKPEELAAAAIAVENIHAPVLFISSRRDKLWPSAAMSNAAEARMREHHFAFSIENLQFDDASHLLMGYGPGMTKLSVPLLFSVEFGGSAEGTRKARDQGWAAAKAFLARIESGRAATASSAQR